MSLGGAPVTRTGWDAQQTVCLCCCVAPCSFPRSFIWSQGFASAPPTATADRLKALNGNGNGHGHDNHSSKGDSGTQTGNGNGRVEGHSSNSQNTVDAPRISCSEPQVNLTVRIGPALSANHRQDQITCRAACPC